MTSELHFQLKCLYRRLGSGPCGVTAWVAVQNSHTSGSTSWARTARIPVTHTDAAQAIEGLQLGGHSTKPECGSAPSYVGQLPTVWVLVAKKNLDRQPTASNQWSVQTDDWSAQKVRCEKMNRDLTDLLRALPHQVADRLGLGSGESYDSRTTFGPVSWVVALCRLGHLFPKAVLGVVREIKPSGVVMSRLSDDTDFLTASAAGVFLLLDALRGTERGPRPVARDEFTSLHAAFSGWSDRGNTQITWKRVRGAPPAPTGGSRSPHPVKQPPAALLQAVLARGDAATVLCEVSGPGASAFQTLAARAGDLLPRWPSTPYAAVLADPYALEQRLKSGTDGGSTDQGSGCGWSDNCGMVTDHRTPIERWLGWVLETLARFLPEALRLNRPTEGGGEQTVVLSGFNPFTASARAIELARLLPGTDADDDDTAALAGRQSASPPTGTGGPSGGGTVRAAGSAGGSGAISEETLHRTEMVILEVLAKARPTPLLIEEIQTRGWSDGNYPAKNTIRKHLDILINDKCLVYRPGGIKGGATLTTEGQEFTDRLHAQRTGQSPV